jgi:hypothetical protein
MLVFQFDNSHIEPFDFLECEKMNLSQKLDDLGLVVSMNGLWPSLVPGMLCGSSGLVRNDSVSCALWRGAGCGGVSDCADCKQSCGVKTIGADVENWRNPRLKGVEYVRWTRTN